VERILRKEVERTSCCQGFTYSHSASGGTGSGLSMQIYARTDDLLKPSFGGTYFFTVLPSKKISNTVIEPYNCVLTLDKLATAENVVCLDNEALYRICFDTLGLATPTFGDLNRLISMVLSGNTASFRFPGSINTDMNKLSYSLRARPFLHYYIPSFAPLCALKNQPYRNLTVSELVRQMTLSENMMVESQPDQEIVDQNPDRPIDGKCFAYAALFRGQMTSQEVDECLVFLRGDQQLEEQLRTNIGHAERFNPILKEVKTSQEYNNNNPRPTFNTITEYAPPGMPMSVTYLRNTTQIKFKFCEIIREAMKMYSTGAFVHWFDVTKNPKYVQTNHVSLPEALNKMQSEWIPEFGTEDMTEYPGPQTEDAIMEEMIR